MITDPLPPEHSDGTSHLILGQLGGGDANGLGIMHGKEAGSFQLPSPSSSQLKPKTSKKMHSHMFLYLDPTEYKSVLSRLLPITTASTLYLAAWSLSLFTGTGGNHLCCGLMRNDPHMVTYLNV